MTQQLELKADKRQVLGKKVRFLRREGLTPAHLFGHNVESLSLQVETRHMQQILSQAGRTRLISLSVGKSKKPRNVLAREVQKNAITGELIHVDLYEVSMEEKITCQIPIVLVGEAPALKLKENILAQELDILEIECLPAEIPQSIPVDISTLTEVDQTIRVKDLALGKEVTLKTDPDVLIVKISERPKEEEFVKPVEVAAEAAAAEVPATAEKAEEAKGEKAGKEQPKAEKPAKEAKE